MTRALAGVLAVATLYTHLISDDLRNRLTRRVLCDHPEFSGEEAEMCVDSALGYLQLCARHPNQRFVPSSFVDIGWHTFLLYTSEYKEFCDRIAGRFIHHSPHDDGGEHPGSASTTVRFMKERSVPFHEEAWRLDAKRGTGGDCGEGDCNSDGDA